MLLYWQLTTSPSPTRSTCRATVPSHIALCPFVATYILENMNCRRLLLVQWLVLMCGSIALAEGEVALPTAPQGTRVVFAEEVTPEAAGRAWPTETAMGRRTYHM